MAKGKYAARAAKHQTEAQYQHIDRLTDQLAEAKIRARQYERDAALVPHLRKRLEELEYKLDNDVVVQEILDKALAYRKALERAFEKNRGLQQAICEASGDLLRATNATTVDFAEYIGRRWPGLIMEHSDTEHYTTRWGVPRKPLSEEAVKRLQRARGLRAITPDGDDAADLFIKVFAADAEAPTEVEASHSDAEATEGMARC